MSDSTNVEKAKQAQILGSLVDQHKDSDEPSVDSITVRITFDKPLRRSVMRVAADVFEVQLGDVLLQGSEAGDAWGFLRSNVAKVDAWATRDSDTIGAGRRSEGGRI